MYSRRRSSQRESDGAADNTWEPRDNLHPDLIADFEGGAEKNRDAAKAVAADAHERLTALLRETEAASAACCDATAAALSGDHRGWAGAMARANSSH